MSMGAAEIPAVTGVSAVVTFWCGSLATRAATLAPSVYSTMP